MSHEPYVLPFEKLRMTDVESVGGKNASLGEMISQLASLGVRVPGGFATTAEAYREFLAAGGLAGSAAERARSGRPQSGRLRAELLQPRPTLRRHRRAWRGKVNGRAHSESVRS